MSHIAILVCQSQADMLYEIERDMRSEHQFWRQLDTVRI